MQVHARAAARPRDPNAHITSERVYLTARALEAYRALKRSGGAPVRLTHPSLSAKPEVAPVVSPACEQSPGPNNSHSRVAHERDVVHATEHGPR